MKYVGIRIKGITGTPLFIAKIQGYMDQKRGAVVYFEGSWTGHYIEKKQAYCQAYIYSIYQQLEQDTSHFYKESNILSVEYEDAKNQRDELNNKGLATLSESERNEVLPRLNKRIDTIRLRLAAVDENISRAVNMASLATVRVCTLKEQRIHEYLHGATLKLKTVETPLKYTATALEDCEKDFKTRHEQNDNIRKSIIMQKGGK